MSLELRTEPGVESVLLQDGKPIKNVRLVSIEAEHGVTAIHIEMYPADGTVVNLESGEIHWIVMCPNCSHNSVHTCELADMLEPELRFVGSDGTIATDENLITQSSRPFVTQDTKRVTTFGPGGDNIPLHLPTMPLPPGMPAEDK